MSYMYVQYKDIGSVVQVMQISFLKHNSGIMSAT